MRSVSVSVTGVGRDAAALHDCLGSGFPGFAWWFGVGDAGMWVGEGSGVGCHW